MTQDLATPGAYARLQSQLRASPRRWLVTGAAGFIGSHLVETLLGLGQHVVGLDNFATGHPHNLSQVRAGLTGSQWQRFEFVEADILDLQKCRQACAGVDHVLHQAALGSVPRSLADPLATHAANVTGFLNMLAAAREAGVRSFVYAGSSSTYGDHPALPKVEDTIGRPLSPYAVTKYANELYADVFARSYGMALAGLRYFNVFGPRQDPDGPYAAVIPRWVSALLRQAPVSIYGDGETSRDFCYVANAVQANLLAACEPATAAGHQVYNVAVGERTTLKALFGLLCERLQAHGIDPGTRPRYEGFRPGDVRHSQADIGKAQRLLGYVPTHRLADGLDVAVPWYVRQEQGRP